MSACGVGQVVQGGLPGRIVMVFQGGGALGAYQVGVYEALNEAGIEPEWVVGTSIGAINAAIIAGNPRDRRIPQLHAFWAMVAQAGGPGLHWVDPATTRWWSAMNVMAQGINGFFKPNPRAFWGLDQPFKPAQAGMYSTAPLAAELPKFLDLDLLNSGQPRITVGAVGVHDGEMRYFDSRDTRIDSRHIMASGALPPAFPAVRIGDEHYWDGGIYSNTPAEVVFDDNPRRDSLVFAVQLWEAAGSAPTSLRQVLARAKEIQYASQIDSHIERQRELHHLRHVIQQLVEHLEPDLRRQPHLRDLASHGCSTVTHFVELIAPRLDGQDHTGDIDFTAASIEARRQAGRADALRALEQQPWTRPVDPTEGVVVHVLRGA